MRRSSIIEKPLALVAVLLLLLSAAPKKFLHDLVADHHDYYSALPGDELGVSNTGFDCHIHDLVVSTPFLVTSLPSLATLSAGYGVHPANHYVFHLARPFSTKDSRGPPAHS